MLILLEKENRILQEIAFTTFQKILVGDENTEEKFELLPMENKFCDFDGTRFRVLIAPEDLTAMKVSISIPSWSDLASHDAEQHLKTIYGDLVAPTEADYNFTLKINLKAIPSDYAALASKLSLLKFHSFGAPFMKYFKALAAGKATPAGKIRVSDETSIFFSAKNDRVVVCYALHFKEKFDEVIARVFLNSFVDVKRNLGPAPVVSYDPETPSNEMKTDFGMYEKISNGGFFSFVLLPRHVQTPEKIDLAAAQLQNFRNYISYHIKCSKTYFHSQMRQRVKDLLQILNRAKSADEEDNKKKKTASGRTFTQN